MRLILETCRYILVQRLYLAPETKWIKKSNRKNYIRVYTDIYIRVSLCADRQKLCFAICLKQILKNTSFTKMWTKNNECVNHVSFYRNEPIKFSSFYILYFLNCHQVIIWNYTFHFVAKMEILLCLVNNRRLTLPFFFYWNLRNILTNTSSLEPHICRKFEKCSQKIFTYIKKSAITLAQGYL